MCYSEDQVRNAISIVVSHYSIDLNVCSVYKDKGFEGGSKVGTIDDKGYLEKFKCYAMSVCAMIVICACDS